MRRHYSLTDYQVLQAIRLFRYSTRASLVLFFLGNERGRSKALETLLPKLTREGKLIETWHKGKKVYCPFRKNMKLALSLEHEVKATDVLVRLWRCRMEEGEIVAESAFRGYAVIPDGAIRYSLERGTMLLCEYSTQQNFSHGAVMKSKLTRYKKHLEKMEKRFEREITVLFILDASRTRIEEFVIRKNNLLNEPVVSAITGRARYPFFFTDYETFKSLPVGQALTKKIYFWHDGKEYSLSHE